MDPHLFPVARSQTMDLQTAAPAAYLVGTTCQIVFSQCAQHCSLVKRNESCWLFQVPVRPPFPEHASRWAHTDSPSWDFIPFTNSAELCSKIFTPNVQNSDRFDPINCIPRTGASNCGSQTDFPDSFWLDCLAFIVCAHSPHVIIS